MNIQPPPPGYSAAIEVKKTESVVEGSLERMVRVRNTSGVEPSSKQIVSAPPEVNGENIALDFSIDPTTGDRVVRILDKKTGEVIRQVPPEEVLRVMAALRSLKGLLLSTKS
jgi:flagellar protein FlaG